MVYNSINMKILRLELFWGLVQNKNLHLVDFISYCTPHKGVRIEIALLRIVGYNSWITLPMRE